MPTSPYIPTEAEEAHILVAWLRIHGFHFHHSANETGHSLEARRRAVRVKREGTSKGFPDYLILLPPDRCKDGRGHLLAIELKRLKGGSVSPEQRAWVEALNGLQSIDIRAEVCRGADEAIQLVSSYLGKPSPESEHPF